MSAADWWRVGYGAEFAQNIERIAASLEKISRSLDVIAQMYTNPESLRRQGFVPPLDVKWESPVNECVCIRREDGTIIADLSQHIDCPVHGPALDMGVGVFESPPSTEHE